ncbi:MAG: hypothetical protein C4334_10285 [Pyrinomonas sp.]
MDWSAIELRVFSSDGQPAIGLVALPDCEVKELELEPISGGFRSRNDPLGGRVRWPIERFAGR